MARLAIVPLHTSFSQNRRTHDHKKRLRPGLDISNRLISRLEQVSKHPAVVPDVMRNLKDRVAFLSGS